MRQLSLHSTASSLRWRKTSLYAVLAVMPFLLIAAPGGAQDGTDGDAESYISMLICTGAAADEYHGAGDDPVTAVARSFEICQPEVDAFVRNILRQPALVTARLNARLDDAAAERAVLERQIFPLKVQLVDQLREGAE